MRKKLLLLQLFCTTHMSMNANFFDVLGDVAHFFGFHPEKDNYTRVKNATESHIQCRAPQPDRDQRKKAASDLLNKADKMPGSPHLPINNDPKQAYKDYNDYKDQIAAAADGYRDAEQTVTVQGNICDPRDASKEISRRNSCNIITSDGTQEEWEPGICTEKRPDISGEHDVIGMDTPIHHTAFINCKARPEDIKIIQSALPAAFEKAKQAHQETIKALQAKQDSLSIAAQEKAFTDLTNSFNRLYTRGEARVALPIYPGGSDIFDPGVQPHTTGFQPVSFIPTPFRTGISKDPYNCSDARSNPVSIKNDTVARQACLFPLPDGKGTIIPLVPQSCETHADTEVLGGVAAVAAVAAGPFS